MFIAGEGSQYDSLVEMVENSDLGQRAIFLGLRNDIPDLLNGCDAVVISSLWEGMPNTILEALAAGKPVVATDVGGVTELVKNGINGFVVPPSNPDKLAEAMQKLMKLEDSVRQEWGEKGRKTVEDSFAQEKVQAQWVDLFNLIIKKKPRHGDLKPVD